MIPCYVAGKGMYATETTWEFKTAVILQLERTGLGFDTRFRYYRDKWPEKPLEELARLVCDPVEYYDPDWPHFYANKKDEGKDKDELATEFMFELDGRFRRQAQVGIYCLDEAGFGTGINIMRFLQVGKPVLAFYNPEIRKRDVNVSNILQLKLEYPFLATLSQYRSREDITAAVGRWLTALNARTSSP